MYLEYLVIMQCVVISDTHFLFYYSNGMIALMQKQPFTALAAVYDAIMADVEYDHWADFVLSFARDGGWSGRAARWIWRVAPGASRGSCARRAGT